MRMIRRVFETNEVEHGRKTYSDLMIDYVKKYGVINIWKWYCIDKGKFVKVI